MSASRVYLATICAALLLAAPAAQAATFDFLAAGNADEHGANPIVLLDSGITVTATGRSLDNTSTYYAYLDSDNSGLGVCKALGGSGGDQCVPNDDDNVTIGEVLDLLFSNPVQITAISFRDGEHNTTFVDGYDGAATVDPLAIPTLVAAFGTSFDPENPTSLIGLMGTNFQFISNSTIVGTENPYPTRQFYISSITVSPVRDLPGVPEPGTICLFGLGLAALGLRSRSRK